MHPRPICSSGNLGPLRSEEHTSELQSRFDLVCRLLLEKKKSNESGFAGIRKHELQFAKKMLNNTAPIATLAPTLVTLETAFKTTSPSVSIFFFINTATTDIYTLSLHDALPI